ncbi:MAG: PleD family two-component system response regulator [Mariprofundaceae bacterium]
MNSAYTNMGMESEVKIPLPYRVLLVDDQAIIAEAVRRMLGDADDLELHYCENGSEALRMAAEIMPAVILQDLVMPDVDGLDLLRFYRAFDKTRDIPVVVLSSKEEANVKAEAFARGANDYLVKLPDKIELLARLRYHTRAYIVHLERDAALRELERLSSIDGLTSIANRRSFDQTLQKEWKRCARDKKPLSLALMDVDNFKLYNDHYGHQAGDSCLQKVATAINACFHRPGDLAARYGGEEFVVILPDTPLEGAEVIADMIRQSVSDLDIEHKHAEAAKHVTISIGIACATPAPKSSPEALIKAADQALYKAKESGRNQVCKE